MFSSTQFLELLVVLCAVYGGCSGFSNVRSALVRAEVESGPVRPDTVPTRLWGAPFSALQAIVCSLIPTIYIFTVVCAGLQQPQWMNAFALPQVVFDVRLEGMWKNTLRVLACVGSILAGRIVDSVFEHLGDQYHAIGRREKPKVVQTGPYAWVRHPLYALALLQSTLQVFEFWSYAPLFAFVSIAVVFAVKISIEEEAIQRDDAIREEYHAYMRKVPARLVPYVW